jgi:hypothetical protein
MRTTNHTLRLGAALVLAILLSSYLLDVNADATEIQDISKISSCIHVEENQRVVNGGIRIQCGAIASQIGTVNGGIDIEDDAEIDSAETLNGGIDVGGIKTNSGTVIRDDVVTVNGKARLRNTLVNTEVQTSNDDIEVHSGSTLEGDIIVRSRSS